MSAAEPHCFIIRLNPGLDEAVTLHRKRLAELERRPVALAEAARDLLLRGLESARRAPPRRCRQAAADGQREADEQREQPEPEPRARQLALF